MKRTLLVYGIAYFVLLIFVFGLLYLYPKEELHLLLNSYHTGIEDTFFKYYSMLAEGPLYVLALLPILWKKIKLTIFYALCELSGGAFLQLLKHTFSFERPASVFEHYNNAILPMVEGVNMHHGNSFPSGHASTFFVFCTCCALFLAYRYKQRTNQHDYRTWLLINLSMLALVVLAALGGYSRIYLSQHFLSDVCVGSIIGFITPCLMFYFGRNKILKLKTNETK
ncbi:MAG: phosphatase PAP2 family protein [Prevotella sp.]|nr:phosphatase PAP2 family protein [Prevotella sp.]